MLRALRSSRLVALPKSQLGAARAATIGRSGAQKAVSWKQGQRGLHSSSRCLTSAHITTAPELPFGSDLVKDSIFAPNDTFTRRHVGPDEAEIAKMLETLGYDSLNAFANDVVPESIRIDEATISDEGGMHPLSETEMLRRATELSEDNEVYRSFIGMGYHQAVVPPVILRKSVAFSASILRTRTDRLPDSVLENPAWYTQYTPYRKAKFIYLLYLDKANVVYVGRTGDLARSS